MKLNLIVKPCAHYERRRMMISQLPVLVVPEQCLKNLGAPSRVYGVDLLKTSKLVISSEPPKKSRRLKKIVNACLGKVSNGD